MNKCQVFVVVLIGVLGFTSCGKESSFPSTPDLKYKGISPKSLSTAETVAITCSFRDKEGDIQNTMWFKVYNLTIPDNSTPVFAKYDVPQFPEQKNMEGDITLILKPTQDFSVGTPEGGGADSVYFELFLKDRAGHISDTIRTDTIYVHH